jgi:hypothetical protein
MAIQSQDDFKDNFCRNPTLRECEDEIHTPKMGTWESSKTPEKDSRNLRV